jgi:hypothetical protein
MMWNMHTMSLIIIFGVGGGVLDFFHNVFPSSSLVFLHLP